MKKVKISILTVLCEKSSRREGFTLVEVMIVVAIIGIVMAILVPFTLQMLPDYRLKTAVRNLVSDMQRTRMNAVKNGLSWQVDFDTVADTYTVRDPGPNRTMGDVDDRLMVTTLSNYGSGVAMPPDGGPCGSATGTWATPPGAINQRADVSFTSRGTCVAGSTYITNQNNSICYAITTTAACAVKIRKYNGITPFHQDNWLE